MKDQAEKERSLPLSGWILAVITLAILLAAAAVLVKESVIPVSTCTYESQGKTEDDTFSYDIRRGQDGLVHLLVITIDRRMLGTFDEAADYGRAAMDIAGEKIALIRDSAAVSVDYNAFDNEDQSYTVEVVLTIKPQKLGPADYEYLNANGFIKLGTVNWQKALPEDLVTVFEADGMTCTKGQQ